MKRHLKALGLAIGMILLFLVIGIVVTNITAEWALIIVGVLFFYAVFYFADIDGEKKEKKLYSDIEGFIIWWNNDGTKTAGELTRHIMDLIKQYEKDK